MTVGEDERLYIYFYNENISRKTKVEYNEY